MTSEFAVRPATPDDAVAVKVIARTSWHATYDDLLGAETVDATVEEWYDVGRLADAARSDEHVFLVAAADGSTAAADEADARADGSVVAFAHVVPDDNALAHLLRIYALPEWWGAGVGIALLERAESRLRGRGFERLRLTVFAENEVGVGFYESRGFERVAEREETFDGETYLEYVYQKAL